MWFHRGKWDRQDSLGFLDTNKSPNFGQTTRPSDSRQKKENLLNRVVGRSCWSRKRKVWSVPIPLLENRKIIPARSTYQVIGNNNNNNKSKNKNSLSNSVFCNPGKPTGETQRKNARQVHRPCRRIKKAMEDEIDGSTNYDWCVWKVPEGFVIGLDQFEIGWRTGTI